MTPELSLSVRLVVFSLVVLFVECTMDIYVLNSWRRFVRVNMRTIDGGISRWFSSAWWYRIPIAIAFLMIFVFPITLWMRQTQSHPSVLNRALHIALAVWYMPKLPMCLFLLGRDAARLLRRLWQHFMPMFIANLWLLLDFWRNVLVKRIPRLERYLSPRQSHLSENRRAFLRKSLAASGIVGTWALAAAPVAALGYNMWDIMYNFQVHRVTIALQNLPRQFDGVTIAQLSDLHASSLWSDRPLQEMRRITHDLKPDMIVVTGDWVNFRANELPILIPEITNLCGKNGKRGSFYTAPLGVFGSLGNHDHYAHAVDIDDIIAGIRSTGVDLLVNENHVFSVDGGIIQLGGNDNVGLRQNYGDLTKTLSGLSPEYPTILMAHDPTLWDKQVRGFQPNGITVDLMLAGHTHGGQMGVRVADWELSPAMFLYRQWAGLYVDREINPRQYVYVNRGIGTTGIPARIGIPPEITLITLQKA